MENEKPARNLMEIDNEYIEVRNADEGKGLFAARDIPSGTVLLKIEGKQISFADTVALGENESYCLQVGMDKYIALHFPFFLSNHACCPNCGVTEKLEFKTITSVKKGEELRWDYSTSMLERHWTMQCECGCSNCRKQVADFDLLPRNVQQKYLKQGLVQPFIAAYLGY